MSSVFRWVGAYRYTVRESRARSSDRTRGRIRTRRYRRRRRRTGDNSSSPRTQGRTRTLPKHSIGPAHRKVSERLCLLAHCSGRGGQRLGVDSSFDRGEVSIETGSSVADLLVKQRALGVVIAAVLEVEQRGHGVIGGGLHFSAAGVAAEQVAGGRRRRCRGCDDRAGPHGVVATRCSSNNLRPRLHPRRCDRPGPFPRAVLHSGNHFRPGLPWKTIASARRPDKQATPQPVQLSDLGFNRSPNHRVDDHVGVEGSRRDYGMLPRRGRPSGAGAAGGRRYRQRTAGPVCSAHKGRSRRSGCDGKRQDTQRAEIRSRRPKPPAEPSLPARDDPQQSVEHSTNTVVGVAGWRGTMGLIPARSIRNLHSLCGNHFDLG